MPNNRTNLRNPTLGKPKFHARRYWRSQLNPPRRWNPSRAPACQAACEAPPEGPRLQAGAFIQTKYCIGGPVFANPRFADSYTL